jgi:hypothetical protein
MDKNPLRMVIDYGLEPEGQTKIIAKVYMRRGFKHPAFLILPRAILKKPILRAIFLIIAKVNRTASFVT